MLLLLSAAIGASICITLDVSCLSAAAVGAVLAFPGRFTREEEVRYCVDRLVVEATRLREMSPLYDAAMEAERGGGDSPKMVWT